MGHTWKDGPPKDPTKMGYMEAPKAKVGGLEAMVNDIGSSRETFTPTLDRVLVDPLAAPQSAGKVIVDRSKEPPSQGVVIAAGKGPYISEKRVAGDIVVFSKYGGTEITLNGHKFLILSEKEILGVIHRAPAPAQSAEPELVALSTEGV